MSAGTIEKLRRTRSDYQDERTFQRFLLDAYTGTGGFAGRVKPPQWGYLGWAAEAYSTAALFTDNEAHATEETYLDRFPREDDPKFTQRKAVAHYDNYVGPIFDLFMSYSNSAQFSRNNIPDQVTDWMEDVTGTGVTWDTLQKRTLRPRAALLGWCPLIFDKDEPKPGEVVETRADEVALGLKLRAVALFPSNVLDWDVDEKSGALKAVKIRTTRTVRDDLMSDPATVEEYRIWTVETVSVYSITTDASGAETLKEIKIKEPHDLGCVPMVVYRNKPTQGECDEVRGISLVADIAVANRRLFNLHSELDEHIRVSVFAILGVPMNDTSQETGSIVGGNGSVIKVPMESRLPLHFVAPPESVAGTLETRIKNQVREIYRTSNAPFEAESGSAQSGTSRAYQFESTNRKLTNMSDSFAESEQQALRIVSTIFGVAVNDNADVITVSAPNDYRVDDFAVDLDNVVKAVGIAAMPETGVKIMVLRLLDRAVPNATPEQRAQMEAEIDAKIAAAAQAAEDARAALKASAGRTPQDPAKQEDDPQPKPTEQVDKAA